MTGIRSLFSRMTKTTSWKNHWRCVSAGPSYSWHLRNAHRMGQYGRRIYVLKRDERNILFFCTIIQCMLHFQAVCFPAQLSIHSQPGHQNMALTYSLCAVSVCLWHWHLLCVLLWLIMTRCCLAGHQQAFSSHSLTLTAISPPVVLLPERVYC